MRTLIVDEADAMRSTTSTMLAEMGHEVVPVADANSALQQLDQTPFDVAVVDLKLNGAGGLDLMRSLQARSPGLDVVISTAKPSCESAAEAMRAGAVDYLPKPFTSNEVRQVLSKIARARKQRGHVPDLDSRIPSCVPQLDMETADPQMRKAFDLALKIAALPVTILLLGESGTGKSVLAKYIHENSPQREHRLVTVSCPSLSRELLESELFGHAKGSFTGAVGDTWGKVAAAEGGTLFLDEIGEMPLEIQPKLLRLLQEKEYERVGEAKSHRANVRIIAATNRDLEQAVKESRFREDLYYRVKVVPLRLPALRERKADLLRIAAGHLASCNAECRKNITGLSAQVEQAFLHYDWPGNLRELRNVIERAVILAEGPEIQLLDLPEEFSRLMDGHSSDVQLGGDFSLQQLENEHIRLVLRRVKKRNKAAQILGIDPITLYRKRKRYGL
jgi:two-component system, NtrC family, response regulator AlgB